MRELGGVFGIAVLAGFALMPTAPPRFFPEWGFVDTLASSTAQGLSQPWP